jgi:hypothetical protein
VWCRDCGHQVEPDPAEQVERYGAETTVPDWRERLVCSECGSREIDMIVTGTSAIGCIPDETDVSLVKTPGGKLGTLLVVLGKGQIRRSY